MRLGRRGALWGAAGLLAAGAARAEDWPTRPIRIVVPFPAGSATDVLGVCTSWGADTLTVDRDGPADRTGPVTIALADIVDLAEQKAQTLMAQADAFRELSSSLTYDA